MTATEPVPDADEVVRALVADLPEPAAVARDVVLVTGPWLAGTTGVLAALRDRLPGHAFVESHDLAPPEAPAAVVFVVSAAAPLTDSDCALIDLAARHTDVVVGVVSKTDAHRGWREVLAADRERLARHADRYRHTPWVGAAARPDVGEPQLDDLVGVLQGALDDPDRDIGRRNRLRVWASYLTELIERYEAEAGGADRQARVNVLRTRRAEVLRDRRTRRSELAVALRSQIAQARVQLGYFARNRCASVRGELGEDAGQISRRRIGAFEGYVRRRAGEVVEEVEDGVTAHLADVAHGLGLDAPDPPPEPADVPAVSAPPLAARGLETRLMMLLGGGFGLGVALAVSRLFAGLAPGLTAAGLGVGAVVGLVLAGWVVGIRGLLRDRAVLDRWVTETTATLRSAVEERVATRVLTAERSLTTALAERAERDNAQAAERIAEIDTELREHAAATSRAGAARDRRVPALRGALAAVQSELCARGAGHSDETPAPDPY